jgi:mono/diheme cytochrome c family protein
MRPSRAYVLVSELALAALVSMVSGCGGGDTPAEDGPAAYMTNCAICHGPKGAGLLGPNITGSTTAGIGSWTDAQFTAAVRTGVDDEGEALCLDMTRFSVALLSDAQLTAIHAFLKANPDNTANDGTSCPP